MLNCIFGMELCQKQRPKAKRPARAVLEMRSQAFGGTLAGAFSGKLLGATALVVEAVKASRKGLIYIEGLVILSSGFRVMLYYAYSARHAQPGAMHAATAILLLLWLQATK